MAVGTWLDRARSRRDTKAPVSERYSLTRLISVSSRAFSALTLGRMK